MADETIRSWSCTDVGRVRDHNEDNFMVDEGMQLFVVADGMGGHASGEVASAMTCQAVREVLLREQAILQAFSSGKVDRKEVLRVCEASVQTACAVVNKAGVEDETKRGMGTTVDVLLIIGNRGFIAHVGDSRIYLHRQGSVHQLTEDHSLINELLRRGRLSRDQISKVQMKNAVTRAVGVYESVEIDVFDFDVLPGDRFVLCSDGMYDYLEEGELTRIFADTPIDKIAQRLIDLSNERGGKDNITAIVVAMPGDDAGLDKLARDVNLKLDILHKMPLFRHATYKELVRLLNITASKTYVPGELVVHEGDEGEKLFIVLSGKVRVHSGDVDITELGQGQHFGEMALVDKAPRSASVTAVEETRLLSLSRRDFFDLIRKDHGMAVKLLWAFLSVLAKRLRTTSRQLGDAREQLAEEMGQELLLDLD